MSIDRNVFQCIVLDDLSVLVIPKITGKSS